ncbi:MAG: hypothetical protein ACFBSG_16550 [Leptolyngbyaceae cyanobacterium]
MPDLSSIQPDATLAELPLFDVRVQSTERGVRVAEQFEQNPDLPGVLVFDDWVLMGLISRRRFHEQVSSPYGREIFFTRPIRIFLEIINKKGQASFLILPANKRIDAAVSIGLQRPMEAIYDPLVVLFEAPIGSPQALATHRLLGFQTLLLAQSEILRKVNQKTEDQWQQTRNYMRKLDEERTRVKQSVKLLEEQEALARERNAVLEEQQIELVNKNEEIAQLNQQFVQISQIISTDGRNAFEATFMGVDGICRSTTEIVQVGRALQTELDFVQKASDMVARVSYQVRHLATKAAIVANHAGSELSGFSQITEEIGKLVGETAEAGQQLQRVGQRFHERIQEFTDAARSSMSVARALTTEINRAQEAIIDLEAVLKDCDVPTSGFREADPPQAHSSEAQALLDVLNQTESILNRIDQQSQDAKTAAIVSKIRRRLQSQRPV